MTTWDNITKPVMEISYLLLEDGGFLLQEDGSKIVLSYGIDYNNQTKPTGSYSNQTKPS